MALGDQSRPQESEGVGTGEPIADDGAVEGTSTAAIGSVQPETALAPAPEVAAPAAAEPEPVAAEPAPTPEPLASEPEPTAEPVAAEPDPAPEPVVAEPEPVASEPVVVEPEPVAAEPEPILAPVESAPVAEKAANPAEETPADVAAEVEETPAPAEPEPVAETEGKPSVGDAAPGTAGPTPPGAPAKRPVPAGRILEGVVTSVTADEVELTLDDGRRAVINRRNFGRNNEDPTTVLSVADRVFGAELTREDPKKRVVLSRAWALKKMAWDKIVEISEANKTISGRVMSVGAKGVVVDVGVRGFVPTSHLGLEPISDLSGFADQVLELKVLEADPRKERLVLSRRSLLLKEQRKAAQDLLSSLKPGESRQGTVTSITNYGAFVDVGGGVNGLVHLSELSWQRVRRPSDVVSLGQEVEVRVLDVKAKKRRVSLSLRQMQPDPLSLLNVGDVHTGPVTRLVDFGAFVSLGDVEGLVHLSELAEYRVSTPEEVVAPGDEVGVKILSVDKKRRRVELSIRRAAEFGG